MDSDLVKKVAEKHRVDAALIGRLIDYERTRVHLERRRGARDQLRVMIEQTIDEGGAEG